MTAAEKGKLGEDAVCRYLEQHGYQIRCRNFRIRGGEIDIVAEKGEELCFVEVKTRTSDEYGLPSEAVDLRKRERYRKIALYYCAMMREELDCRFDVSSVRDGEIEYFENAYI